MTIATKTGDNGETTLLGGERLKKNDPRIQAYGAVDELNSLIGVALCYIENEAVKNVLNQVQHDLFTVGSEINSLTQKELSIDLPRITKDHLDFLDQALEAVEDALPKLNKFILPKGTKSASYLHFSRAVCRRAERILVAVEHDKNPLLLKYLNRLSDLLFMFARAENHGKIEEEEVEY